MFAKQKTAEDAVIAKADGTLNVKTDDVTLVSIAIENIFD